tara:strand:- start:4869 stop:5870 length:1002 start_codon:yes stop_codon:yes gene_type:complete
MMPATAQRSAQPTQTTATIKVGSSSSALPTLASIRQALLHQDYTVEQFRRFRDELGNVVTVREQLEVDANGTTRPDFAINFLAVEGEPAGSALSVKWQQAYQRFGNLFFRHGSFQVRDLIKASLNYTLHDFGQVVRAGRVARRMVVFPASVDKAIWVVDIDSITSVPLFIAEFDNGLQLRANIETLTFVPSVQTITPTIAAANVTPMTSYAGAETFLGSPAGLVNPNVMVTPDYALEMIEVHDDPINGRQKLVMSYSDGIDQYMVVQALNSINPFAGLPSAVGGAHTIGRFRDPALSALVFWDDQVTFHIAGRGSLERLDDVASRIYLQALSN